MILVFSKNNSRHHDTCNEASDHDEDYYKLIGHNEHTLGRMSWNSGIKNFLHGSASCRNNIRSENNNNNKKTTITRTTTVAGTISCPNFLKKTKI